MQPTDIEWCDFSANPVRGKCRFACPYCYAEAIRRRFKRPARMTFHPEVLDAIEKRKKPATIFVGSAYDLFGSWVPDEWKQRITRFALDHDKHHLIFLTKNPADYTRHSFTKTEPRQNVWFGATVDTAARAKNIHSYMHNIHFLSIEPLLDDVAEHIYWSGLGGIIVGAESGMGAPRPPVEWVRNILTKADEHGVKVFLKDNLLTLYPDLSRRRELLWPTFRKARA